MSDTKKINIGRDGKLYILYDDSGNTIANVLDGDFAELFAAAPETKGKLDELIDAADSVLGTIGNGQSIDFIRALHSLKAAIEKARKP